ncbi:MAG TPA: N-6 DNA methylase [Armatimonadota bacterium]|nr:N-6 DNA methylase [Armatimonadota bacterium]
MRLEELVLANSGEDEFEEVFKLVIAKLWDESCGKGRRFYSHSNEATTHGAITCLLNEAGQAWPGVLGPPFEPALTPQHLQVCVDVLAQHRISDSSLEVMDNFFEFLVSKSAKGAKGQYFTPRHVVEFCVRMIKPDKGETVVDPACGSGGFLMHAFNYIRCHHDMSEQESAEYCKTKLWGFDIDSRAVRIAKALFMLTGGTSINAIRLNSLLRPDMAGLFALAGEGTEEPENGSSLTIEDVARSQLRHHKGFDVVLTNPPFAGEVRESHLLNGYVSSQGRLSVERDVLFIERCVQLLRPGGRMAIVLPHNKLGADAWGYVRKWLLQNTRVLAVVGLGRNTFLPHTHQKAEVLFLQKNEPRVRTVQEQPIFFGISERDGKNSKGQHMIRPGRGHLDSMWDRLDHDLEEMVEAYHTFSHVPSIDGGEQTWQSG